MLKSLSIFTGNSNRALADEICKFVEIPLGRADVTHFSDGEIYVEIGENVRGVNCFVVQPTCSPPNQALMELLIMIDALKRASAGSIVAIIPYFGYARQDRKAKPRTPITAKLVANLITAAGADRALAANVADDVHDLRDVGGGAPLVDDRERRVEPLGERAGALDAAGVGRDHHGVLAAVAERAQLLDQHRHR